MAHTWWTIRIDLVGGRGDDLWPRPGRILVAHPGHTFRELATACNDAFARWDVGHLHQFTLADGRRIEPGPVDAEDAEEGVLDDAATTIQRLTLGEQFAFVFDLGDRWTHLCTVGEELIDVREVIGHTPTRPLPIFGWGDIPDQYGRRWDADDGSASPPPAPEPPTADLPPLLAGWGPPSVTAPSTPPTPGGALGWWRPLAWTLEAQGQLRGAAVRRDVDTALTTLAGRAPLEVAHVAAPALLAGLAHGNPTAREYAEMLAGELRERWWAGDDELADELAAGCGLRAPTDLVDVPVWLDELASALEDGSLEATPRYLHLPSGQIVLVDEAMTGEPEPDDLEDRDVWLPLPTGGSSEGWHDMRDFIGTVEDGELSERLDDAIRGRGAFPRFRERLASDAVEATRWRRFREERELGRARAFLAVAGYRPAVSPPDARA